MPRFFSPSGGLLLQYAACMHVLGPERETVMASSSVAPSRTVTVFPKHLRHISWRTILYSFSLGRS